MNSLVSVQSRLQNVSKVGFGKINGLGDDGDGSWRGGLFHGGRGLCLSDGTSGGGPPVEAWLW